MNLARMLHQYIRIYWPDTTMQGRGAKLSLIYIVTYTICRFFT